MSPARTVCEMGSTAACEGNFLRGGPLILRVRLPYPNRILSPNAREVWQNLSNPKKVAREVGLFETFNSRQVKFDKDKPLRLRLAIFPPDNRIRDMDNAVSALKSYQDGIFDALEGMDDSMIKRKTITWHNKCKQGKVYYILYQ